LLGVRDTINYEGQAAIELEQLADPAERSGYPVTVTSDAATGALLRVSGADLVRAAADDLGAGVAAPVIAARFHHGVAAAIVAVCSRLRDQTGFSVVALSGGVFQNLLLTSHVTAALAAEGFGVLGHHRIPCNDGGISLGQVAVAGARDRLAPGS